MKVAIETQLITYKGNHDSNDFTFLTEAVKIRKNVELYLYSPESKEMSTYNLISSENILQN